MPPALPPKPLGLFLGPSSASTIVEAFCDPCCPFSKKNFLRLLEVNSWAEEAHPGLLRVKVMLYPQPWHPQSVQLIEAVVAVRKIDESQAIPFLVRLFENVTDFYDKFTYDKTRQQIYDDLSEIAKEFVSQEKFKSLVRFKPKEEGQINSGNDCTQDIKWLVKYGRACGVHVTPTCFVNNIEAGQISSSWELSEWQEFLTPFFNA